MFGTAVGIGASLSPTLPGLVVDYFGYTVGFVAIAGKDILALLVVAALLPETNNRPN
jgi:hypothetical protein